MKSSVTLIALALLGTSFYLHADGELEFEQCPQVVQETIRANARDGDIDDVNSFTLEGRTLYLVEVDLPHKKDLKLFLWSDGKLIKTQEEMTVDETPSAVVDAALKLVPEGGKLDDIDKEVADGKASYLVEIDRPEGPDLNLVLAEDGTLISQTAGKD